MFKGITEAILSKGVEEERFCEIYGPSFDGISTSLKSANIEVVKRTRILMIHGIGQHLPGYSARFREKLVKSLKLNMFSPYFQRIPLTTAQDNGVPAGTLSIFRYLSSETTEEISFYELTWSEISEKEKQVIAFDDSDAYSYRRAGLNNALKGFLNGTVPDLLVYSGNKRHILDAAIKQSICWTLSKEPPNAAINREVFCDFYRDDMGENIKNTNLFIVTHSLGSRMTLDTFNYFALKRQDCQVCERLDSLNDALKNTTINVFMLANQLPLLQVGQMKPQVTDQLLDYCTVSGMKYDERLIGKLRLISFNDPNDILSYPIPYNFDANYIDSRMCPEIINIDLSIAERVDLLGLTDFANPLDAHSGYLEDERVINIIASGLNRHTLTNTVVTKQCHWLEADKLY